MPSYRYHSKKFNQSNVYELAKAAYSTANFIKDAVNIEYKECVNELTLANPFDNPGFIYSFIDLNAPNGIGIPQGTANGERIGDSVKLQRLTLKAIMIKHPVAVVTAFRVILFRGKSERGGTYVPADILENPAILFSSKSEDERYTTKFLHDQIYTLDSAKNQCITFDWDYELNWHANYEAGTSVIEEGGLYLYIVQLGTGSAPSFTMSSRITYTDD